MVRAPPRVLPRSLAPSGVLWGGASSPGSSLGGLACTPCGGCVPRGWWGAVPGGGVACHCCEGRLVSGAVPPPTARHLGRAAGVPRPVCPGCSRCGRGTQHRPHSVRLCGPALLAVGVSEGRPPGGCLPPLCEGRLRSGAPPPPTAHPLGELLGTVTHMLWARVCGSWGPSLPLWPACPVGPACRGGGGGPSPGGGSLPPL